MQEDGVKDLISIAEGTDISDLPVVRPILGSVIWTVSVTPKSPAERTRDYTQLKQLDDLHSPLN